MKRNLVSMMAAAAALTIAGSAQAQICAGFPSSDRGFYFGGRVDFPEGLNSVGAEANYNASGPLGVYGGIDIVSIEDVDDSDSNVFNVGAAFELASVGAMIGPRVSACPQVSFVFSDEEDSGYAIPIGFGLGADLGVPGVPVHGYVIPQLVISHSELLDETDTDFGGRAGAFVGFGMFTIGGEVQHVFVDGADPTFGIRAGIRVP
jgi:hypothetical protein